MLTITIPGGEEWNELTQEFLYHKSYELVLEHSLVSLSKWESFWCKPFLEKSKDPKHAKTIEETISYIRCMTITKGIPEEAYRYLTKQNIEEVERYIDSPMTATKITKNKNQSRKDNRPITSEVIYSWMASYGIPFEPCEKWHLNRLLTLIEVCGASNAPPQKMSKQEIYAQNKALNDARRAQLHSKG